MHTKNGTGDARGGSWTLRLGMIVVGLSLAWSLTGSSVGAAEPCALAVIGTCSEDEQPAPTTTTTTTAPAPPPAPELSSAQAAARLLSLLNDERGRAGLAPFTVRGDVTEIATRWSAAMAQSEHLSHNDAYFTKETRARLDARLLGENVARNPSVDGAHRALMASAPHRANILDGRFVVIGIAAEMRNGSWWVTEDFLQPASGAATPARAASASAPAPAHVAPSTTAARPRVSSPDGRPAMSTAAIAPAPDVNDGEVLAATASAASLADLAPKHPTSDRAVASSASGSTTSRWPVGAVAVGLLVLALVAAYRVSCASASARIRCR